MRFLVALLVILSVGCAGVQQTLPQSQGADNFGSQPVSVTYNVTATATDSSAVNIAFGTTAQDISQQGSTEQDQTSGTGAVDNAPNISPNLSIPIP